MPKFIKHKIDVQIGQTALDFWFISPTQTYEGLSPQQTGVTRLPSPAAGSVDNNAPVCTIEALLSSGVAVRKTIRYTVNNRTRYAKIIVAADLADTFNPTGAFRSGTIRDVIDPLDATFS